jgi:hypothetical protein
MRLQHSQVNIGDKARSLAQVRSGGGRNCYGGEGISLHTSVFDRDPNELVPGTKMEFKVMAGDLKRKAFAAHLIDDEPENDLVPPPRPVSPLQPVQPVQPVQGPGPAFRAPRYTLEEKA